MRPLVARGGESNEDTDEGDEQSSETERLRLWAMIVDKCTVENFRVKMASRQTDTGLYAANKRRVKCLAWS